MVQREDADQCDAEDRGVAVGTSLPSQPVRTENPPQPQKGYLLQRYNYSTARSSVQVQLNRGLPLLPLFRDCTMQTLRRAEGDTGEDDDDAKDGHDMLASQPRQAVNRKSESSSDT